MGAAESGIEKGERGCLKIRTGLLGGGAIGPAKQVRYMGPDTAYAEVDE